MLTSCKQLKFRLYEDFETTIPSEEYTRCIDSTLNIYYKKEKRKRKKIENTQCIGDSVFEIRVLKNNDERDVFQFDKKAKLINLIHEIPEIY